MATSKGIIELDGTLGGISFYQRKGKRVVRKAGGPTKEEIVSSKRFQRTRENATEFGGAATASAALRKAMDPFSRTFSNWNISSRLTARFVNMVVKGAGIRGQRTISGLLQKEYLIGFDFNEELPLSQIFRAKTKLTCSEDRKSVELSLNKFQTSRDIYKIQGASHVVLFFAIAEQRVFNYEASSNKYVSLDYSPFSNGVHARTEQLPVDDVIQNISLPASLSDQTVMEKDSALICAIGIEFYQQVGFEYYPLKSGKSMRIVEVF